MLRSKKLGLLVISAVVAISFVIGGCSSTPAPTAPAKPATPPPAPAKTSVDVRGSDTMINLGAAWAEAYMAKNKSNTIVVQGGGSGTGVKALINKNCDIANASRPMSAQEVDDAKKNGVTPKEFVVAFDGVGMIVNKANTVNELSTQQLAKIFRGEVTNWKDVGGKNEPIVVLARDTASGTHVFIKEHVVQENGKVKGAEYGKGVQFLTSNQAIATEVAQNPRAIGYVGLGYLTDKTKTLKVKKDASTPGVAPAVATVKDKSYDLSRPLFMYSNGEPTGVVKSFVDFVMSDEGQKLVEKLDFVPVR